MNPRLREFLIALVIFSLGWLTAQWLFPNVGKAPAQAAPASAAAASQRP